MPCIYVNTVFYFNGLGFWSAIKIFMLDFPVFHCWHHLWMVLKSVVFQVTYFPKYLSTVLVLYNKRAAKFYYSAGCPPSWFDDIIQLEDIIQNSADTMVTPISWVTIIHSNNQMVVLYSQSIKLGFVPGAADCKSTTLPFGLFFLFWNFSCLFSAKPQGRSPVSFFPIFTSNNPTRQKSDVKYLHL